MMIPVRRAALADAARLADFAAKAFHDAFAADNDPLDIALHVDKSFGVDKQLAELANPEIVTLLAERDGDLMAYAQLRSGAPPTSVTTLAEARPMEVWRFYVSKDWHGSGIARFLMATVEMEAERRAANALWLGVLERNARAVAFYRKCGFEASGTQTFVLGTDPQTDIVMTRRLAVQPASRP